MKCNNLYIYSTCSFISWIHFSKLIYLFLFLFVKISENFLLYLLKVTSLNRSFIYLIPFFLHTSSIITMLCVHWCQLHVILILVKFFVQTINFFEIPNITWVLLNWYLLNKLKLYFHIAFNINIWVSDSQAYSSPY